MEDMTKAEKVTYLRIALSLNKIGTNAKTAELIIDTYEAILTKKGDFTIRDAAEIEVRINQKYAILEAQKNKESAG